MNVELISIGTELLLGDIVNTNTNFLSKELANLGINVFKQTSVGDNRKRILDSFSNAFEESDTIIVTGGLGPTEDDLTKECAAEFFEKDLVFDDSLWIDIKNKILGNNKDKVLSENNKKTAYVPKDAILFENTCGTAPGILMEKNNKRIILLPGPPREMTTMFNLSVRDYLKTFNENILVSKYIRFYGIGESLLETKIQNILNEQVNPTIALYAKTGEVLIRVTASGINEEECNILIDKKIEEIANIVGEYIYLIGDDSISSSQTELHKVVGKLLIENNLTISIAESLTGGKVSSSLVENSGISSSLVESIVCYSNESKIKTLGVEEDIITTHGAVSYEVAKQMLEGLLNKNKTDIAVSTTGLAGPMGDGSNAQVGEVYIGIYYKGKVEIKKSIFSGDREYIRDRATKEALSEIRKIIIRK